MRVVSLHHVPFEGLGVIEPWIKGKNADWKSIQVYKRQVFPDLRDVDSLIIMGGPMSVNDEHVLPWLKTEKEYIREAVSAGKVVLGICLGAQLIANVLGARVRKNREPEIGWFPVTRTIKTSAHKIAECFPEVFYPLHWHGETFDLPSGSLHLAKSEVCENQGFIYGKKVLGLQFHLEYNPQSVGLMNKFCPEELKPSRFVENAYQLRGTPEKFNAAHEILRNILDCFYGLS